VKSFFDETGGWPTLDKVHKVFYDKVYVHPWMKQFFLGVEQKRIEQQQSNFMAAIFGGPKRYVGNSPKSAHLRMFITQELMDIRTQLLEESLLECRVSAPNRMIWLSKDKNFHSTILKKGHDEVVKRYATEEVLIIPRPPNC